MGEALKLDYFYGIESGQFTFFRVPKILFKDDRFSGLSNDAKLAYGLMLDRMSWSIENKWFDADNRAYIIYTLDQLANDLGCSSDKATRVFNALDVKQGIGLIERVRRGQGKPDLIYVKNFATLSDADHDKKEKCRDKGVDDMSDNLYDGEGKASIPYNSNDPAKCGVKTPQNYKNQTTQNTDSRLRKKTRQESKKCGNNYTNINDTEVNDTNSINLSVSRTIDEQNESYRELIARNIRLDWLLEAANCKGEDEVDMVSNVYDTICDMVCYPRETVIIRGTTYPWEIVKERYLKLKYDDIANILNRIPDANLGIGDMTKYLISTLYCESLTGAIAAQSKITDDYLKSIRGTPYC